MNNALTKIESNQEYDGLTSYQYWCLKKGYRVPKDSEPELEDTRGFPYDGSEGEERCSGLEFVN